MAGLNLNYQAEVFKDTSQMSREEWLNTRKFGIGGSEAAIVMGVSPYATKRDLFYDKTGKKLVQSDPEEENWVAKAVGTRLEEVVAMIFSQKTGFSVYPDKHMYQHPLFPFMKADLDFIIEFEDGTQAILECKTCNYNSQFKWKDGKVPVNYEWQCRHYMAVKNLDTAYVACLYGNNESEFFIRKLERDLDMEQDLIEAEQDFWENYVEKGVLPPYEEAPDLVLDSIRKFVGEPDKKIPEITLDDKNKEGIKRYLVLAERKAELEAEKKQIEKEQKTLSIPIVESMGTGCRAVLLDGTDRYQVTYNPTYRKAVKKEDLLKLEYLYPDAYADVVTESVSRTFRIKKEAA